MTESPESAILAETPETAEAKPKRPRKPRNAEKAPGSPATASTDADDRSDVQTPDSVTSPGFRSPDEVLGGGLTEQQRAKLDHLEAIEKARHAVARAEQEHEFAVASAKDLKKRWEGKQAELDDLIDRGPETMPLFNAPKAEPKPKPEAPDESWREARLDALSIPAKTLGQLAEAGLYTVGDVSDYVAGGKALTDIPGVGRASAETIDDALRDYWTARAAGGDEPEPEPGPDVAEIDETT